MTQRAFQSSELILNSDGSVYHLAIGPEHVADTVIIVGDQGRVEKISRRFDSIEHSVHKREFKTHTGTYQGKRLTVCSTGIGTDNIDIFMNELDAAVNIDLENKQLKESRKSLNIIRLGTCGALHEDIPVGGHIISTHGLGLGGLMHFYEYPYDDDELAMSDAIQKHLSWQDYIARPYIVKGAQEIVNEFMPSMTPGITATAPGFYAPQGRSLYLPARYQDVNERLREFSFEGKRVANFEMETSVLYGLGNLLGHRCATCCVVLANRATGDYAQNSAEVVESLIDVVLEKVLNLS